MSASDKRLVRRLALLLMAPFVPFIRIPYALWYWAMDVGECYVHWWKEFKAGEPVEW